MLALRTSPPVFAVAEAERIARECYDLSVSAQPLSGERDCNFRLRGADQLEYVLKIVDREATPEAIDCQIRVLRHLAEADPALPVPRIHATAQGEDVGTIRRDDGIYTACLMGYLPGQLLAQRAPAAALLLNLGDTLARLDRALQGFFHPALAQRLAWDVRRLPELVEFAPCIHSLPLRNRIEEVSAELARRMPALRSLRSQAIHGDCHGHNLLVDAEGVGISGILDFGDMIHAPLVFEPAVAMSELLSDDLAPLDALSLLLRGYSQRQPLEPADVEVLYDLIAGRLATTILVHAFRGRQDDRGAAVLDRPAALAARSLDVLTQAGRDFLTKTWHDAADSTSPSGLWAATAAVDLSRRHRLLGAGAELFYEQPLHIVRGSGVWLYDSNGRPYLDVYNNVPHVGHAHPTVVRAIQKQSAILSTHTRYLHGGILEYAERLTATLPAHLDACIFVNSGSEANDVAWRIAQSATGNKGALVMKNAYHGITDAVAALTPGTGEPRDARVVTLAIPPTGSNAHEALARGELAAATEDADRAVHSLSSRGFAPAAFFVDSALTSSGILDPPPEWAAAVAERVRAAGGLIVADEVQYGLGRSGSHFWGFARRGFEPDIVTLGKPVGNGYPLGVVIANRALIEAFQSKFGFFSTFGGNPVAAAAGLAVLEVLDREQLMSNAHRTGEYLRRRLTDLAARHPCLGAVRGVGLLLGLEIIGMPAHPARQRAKRIINILVSQARVLIGYEGPEAAVLKLRPPMPFRVEHADLLIDALDAAATMVETHPGGA
ncbi:MAG: aminotransferase class III-fold pyridoxal phosphate-dependent enzyme [Steroidobacteraceae bacterium]